MSGTILTIAGSNNGMLQPAEGGPPLPFDQADTVDSTDLLNGGTKTLTQSLVGSSVTFVYDGGTGRAKKVRF